MAARWGAAEETILTACNMDFFQLETLGEAAGLISEENLQSCVDPSLLSIFEDVPTLETKGLDEDSEATLLTALTEILDNVGDENLSPFDTLPDSDLLSKGREHSPLRRVLCLSRSPQKDSLCGTRPLSTGKSLSRMLATSVQRSDGEEEEDGSFTQSPDRDESSPGVPGWEGLQLPLPVMLEHEGEDGLSVSLGDLVRHMHPYCMGISVENEEGEQMLPEGGILLEVVDQGENGEPILAIPNMDLSYALHPPPPEHEGKEATEGELSDSSEHIVVDDEDDVPVAGNCSVAAAITPAAQSDEKDAKVGVRSKKERKTTSPSRRNKKGDKKKQQPELVEGRVLRSGAVRKVAADCQKKPEKESVKEKARKSQKGSSTAARPLLKPEVKRCKPKKEDATAAQLPKKNERVVPPAFPKQSPAAAADEGKLKGSASAVSCQQPGEAPRKPAPEEEPESPPAAPSVSLPGGAAVAAAPDVTPPISITPAAPEPKPKSLSLEEYRRLRQQKKPAPVEKQDTSVTKWPSLPELPKELPPIPHLPDPNPRDPRRASPQAAKKEVEEIKPAWQPRGPCAPPTPEALLQPPAYMISSSSKASATVPASKPQQTQDPSKLPPKPPAASPDSAKISDTHPQPAAEPTEPRVPQSSAPPASIKPSVPVVSSAHGVCCPPDPGRKVEAQPIDPKSIQDTRICPETTTDVHKPTAASGSLPGSAVVPQKTPGVPVPTSTGDPLPSCTKSPELTAKEQRIRLCAAFSLASHGRTNPPAVVESKQSPTATKPQRAKSGTQELIESFTREMGIEAADLTSLLEQFEKTQAKQEKCVPEVSGRAAAVGNSRTALVQQKAVTASVRAADASHAAALVPKTAPPTQMWKPLTPLALLAKTNPCEASKPSPSKVIQIEAQPLPLVRVRSKATPAAAPVSLDLACMDHDYCLASKSAAPGEAGKHRNVKQQSGVTIKPLKQHPLSPTPPAASAASPRSAADPAISFKAQTVPAEKRGEDEPAEGAATETPGASPSRQECAASPRRGPAGRSYRRCVASRTPSPRCSPEERTRGRSRKRFYRSPSPTSSCSDSYSSRSRSRSKSPAKKRYRHQNSDSSRSSSSRSSPRSSPSLSRSPPRRRRYSYSSSRSGSWSRSRSRSLSPERRAQWSRSRGLHSPSYAPRNLNGTRVNLEETKRRKEKAIEERRVVYVGRIRASMTLRELRERFSYFGEIEECTLHFREHGDNYGFVTYYSTKDAFTAIENGSKLRKPDELPFDLCFGGRRQFCRSSYADLDSSREYEPLPTKSNHALDFDTLLKQAQQNLKR